MLMLPVMEAKKEANNTYGIDEPVSYEGRAHFRIG
jgi:hypothetical protein